MITELSKCADYNKLLACKLFLIDMDGTLYLGDEVFEGAVNFIKSLEDRGIDYIYLTNNSSRSGMDYVKRLNGLGFSCIEKNVYTSGMATAKYLNEKYKERKVLVLGTKAFIDELRGAGLNVFTSKDYDSENFRDVFKTKENADSKTLRKILDESDDLPVVCAGFDTELVYRDLDLAVHFLRKGSPFIAANPDWVCPMPMGEVLPDCGSICALLTASSGVEPLYIGKPNRNMVDIISKERNIPNDKICCVGDRLYTDIKVAQNSGAVSVCVLTGESTISMIKEMEDKPDYTFNHVKDMTRLFS